MAPYCFEGISHRVYCVDFPHILELVVIPFPRDPTQVSSIADRFFTI